MKRSLLIEPRSISFKNDVLVHVTTDVMKSAYSSDQALQDFIDTIWTNIIEREENFINVWSARDYDIDCYSYGNARCVFTARPRYRYDRQKGVTWYVPY